MTSARSRLALASAVAAVAFGAAFSYADETDCCATTTNAGAAMLISHQDAAAQPSAEELLAKYKAVALPEFDPTKREDQAYIQEYMKKQNEAMQQRVEIGRQFIMAYPDHTEAPAIAQATIQAQMYQLGQPQKAQEDINALLEKDNASPEVIKTAKVLNITAMLMTDRSNLDPAWDAVTELAEQYPGDAMVARAMSQVAEASEGEQQVERIEHLLAKFPDNPATKYSKGKLRQANGLNKPFEISFTDALSGEQITSESLKGKVVVIDFWATWCGPCIAEMPKMKDLYSQYKDQGVEFIGISLDAPEEQGGKKALLEYCEENSVSWPQYYQGKGWEGEFSTAWGINSIPAIFILDAEGNLHSTKARGQLEKLIPELIEKRDNPRTAGAESVNGGDGMN